MRVLIDADAFPNIKEIINLCFQYQKEVIVYMDTSHEFFDWYATVKKVDKGWNAVDLKIENEVQEGDLVLTQDYGVATITLSKNAICLDQYGKFYTNDNIDYLLEIKNQNRIKRKHQNIKGPKKRTIQDQERLLEKAEEVLRKC